MNKKFLFLTLLCIIIDQVVKIFISINMNINQSINVINNFFRITYVHNDGAAFSILSGNRLLLIFIAIISLVLIYTFFINNKKLTQLEQISYILLIGGIIGNLIDRILYGYVIDYLDFKIINYNFPIFNLADIFIVISIFLLIILTIKGDEKSGN